MKSCQSIENLIVDIRDSCKIILFLQGELLYRKDGVFISKQSIDQQWILSFNISIFCVIYFCIV